MYTQVEKSKKNKSCSVANSITQKKNIRKQNFRFMDNRLEATIQRKFQQIINSNPQAKQNPNIDNSDHLRSKKKVLSNNSTKTLQRSFNITEPDKDQLPYQQTPITEDKLLAGLNKYDPGLKKHLEESNIEIKVIFTEETSEYGIAATTINGQNIEITFFNIKNKMWTPAQIDKTFHHEAIHAESIIHRKEEKNGEIILSNVGYYHKVNIDHIAMYFDGDNVNGIFNNDLNMINDMKDDYQFGYLKAIADERFSILHSEVFPNIKELYENDTYNFIVNTIDTSEEQIKRIKEYLMEDSSSLTDNTLLIYDAFKESIERWEEKVKEIKTKFSELESQSEIDLKSDS